MLNGDSSQASEATPVEVSKKSIRNDVWRQLQKNQLCVKPSFSFNRIPRFVGSEEAAAALKDLEEFKKAKHVMVNPDRAQDVVRLTCLQAGKTLYVQPPRVKTYLMTKINVAEDASEEDLLKALMVKGLEETGTHIGLDDNLSLDLVVVGTVAVSKDGNRIGRGHSYVDLCLGLLKEINAITPETTIVTVVHDSQVLDKVPANIMAVHDFPVDLIVTPTQVIRTNRKADRPAGVLWNLISERRLKLVTLLATLRDKEIESGKSCTLKETESEPESDNEVMNNRPRRYYRGRKVGRRNGGPNRPQTNGVNHSESEHVENGEQNGSGRKRGPNYQRYPRTYRRSTNTESDGSITKHSFRNKVWQLLQKNRVVTTPRNPFNRIPGYRGTEDVAQVLRQLDQYKNATSVLVNIDKTHEAVRLACMEDGKKLYVLLPRIRNEFIIRIDAPEGENKPELKDMVSRQGMEEHGIKIDMSKEPITLDLLVFGSLAVSKEGFRIGKGSGHADLCYALLRDMKAVTDKTPIVTTVHDYQVFETFPSDLFAPHDVPVDVIVTPTQAIPVEPLKEKPSAIVWNLISPRIIKYMTLVNTMREKLVEAGETCELKKEDENEINIRRRRYFRSQNYSESEPNETGDALESGDYQRRPRGPRRFNRPRRTTNEKGETEGGAESGGNVSPDTTTARKRRGQVRRPRPPIDFSIKLTNIRKIMRIRDLRTALQERSVKPNLITWMGFKGFCYLHFVKPTPSQGDGDIKMEKSDAADTILESLANLTLYPSIVPEDTPQEATLPNKLVVQLAKPMTRIETADQTAV